MDNYKVDVPVALIFFNRPDTFAKVFECVKNNKPSKLFLIQDGPRISKPEDSLKIAACRKICENIDWQCEVYRDFSDVNLGCGRRVYTGLTNAFKIVDRLVIIEDDICFSESFLQFCAELLEKYKDDTRINQISGMNHFGIYEDCDHDYFFSRGGAIWGWATWRRVWKDVEWELSNADNEYLNKTLSRNGYPRNYGPFLVNKAKRLRKNIMNGNYPSFWSFHFLYNSYLNNLINIVPKYNLISNIGLGGDSVHAPASYKKLTHNIQKLFYAKMYEYKFPLNHPMCVLDDRFYKLKQDELMYPRGVKKILILFEYVIRKIIC